MSTHARNWPAVMLNEPMLGSVPSLLIVRWPPSLRTRNSSPMRAPHARRGPADVPNVAPGAVGHRLQPGSRDRGRVGDHLAHRSLDRRGAVALDQLDQPPVGELDAGELRLELEEDQLRQPRAADPRFDDVLTQRAGLDELHRRDERGLRVHVLRGWTKPPGSMPPSSRWWTTL